MRKSQDTNEEQRKAKMKVPSDERRYSQKTQKLKSSIPSHKDVSVAAATRRVVTEEQYVTRVRQKAYELYEKRQATTHLDDWVEAERLVKTELLAEGQWAGSV
jgi:hypothetical protein